MNWNRALPADYDISPALIDGNSEIVWDAILKLAAEGDEFGSVIYNWTELSRLEVLNSVMSKGNSVQTEVGGHFIFTDGGGGAWSIFSRREVAYDDFDIVFEWNDTKAEGVGYVATPNCLLWYDVANWFWLRYYARAAGGNHLFRCHATGEPLLYSADIGIQLQLRTRLKRSGNTFTIYYATWGGAAWNAWVQVWTGTVASFNGLQLKPIIETYAPSGAAVFEPEFNRYFQKTDDGIPAQRFWPTSPEYHVINSAAGAVEFVADMGVGKIFKGSGFSATTADPAGSTNKWKFGYGDTADRASATFDVAFRDEATLDGLVAAGTFDNHRYLFLEGQMNSNGLVRPTLTDVTISGIAASLVGAWGPFGNINALGGGIR